MKITASDLLGSVEITPKRDFEIIQNQHHYLLKEGVPVPIPEKFIDNLITEKVIDKKPTKKKRSD